MANRYQKLRIEAYPNIDLLGLDVGNGAEVVAAVAGVSIGDTIFEFPPRA